MKGVTRWWLGALLLISLEGGRLGAFAELIPPPPRGEYRQRYSWVDFATPRLGYVATDAVLLKTEDGGASWVPILDRSKDGRGRLRQILLVDESTLYVLRQTENGLSRTIDGGRTFQPVTSSVPGLDVDDSIIQDGFDFVDADCGLAITVDQILRTTDGGRSWKGVRNRVDRVRRLVMINRLEAIAVGGDRVFRTDDGGVRWQLVEGSPAIGDAACAPNGFCLGLDPGAMDISKAYLSSDAGLTWRTTPTGLDADKDDILDFEVVGGESAVIAGNSNGRGLLLRWQGGKWRPTEYSDFKQLWAVSFVSANEVWASADANGILYSKDGGNSWRFVPDYFWQVLRSQH